MLRTFIFCGWGIDFEDDVGRLFSYAWRIVIEIEPMTYAALRSFRPKEFAVNPESEESQAVKPR